ncbi:MAG: ABC transporter permease [Actinomycetota bacterium]
MFLLTLRDLQFRAVRFGIAIIGTALVFSMVLIMSGLSARFRNEPRITVEGIGGDHWVVAEGVTGAFTSGATIPTSLADDLEANGADEADPVAMVRHTAEGDTTTDVFLLGHEPGGIGTPEAYEGEAEVDSGAIVAAEETRFGVGDTVKISGEDFEVIGLTRSRTIFGGTPILFMDLADVQQLVYQGQPVATSVVVKGEMPTIPDGFEAKTTEETWQDALRPLEKPVGAIDVVQILLWLVAATIIGAVVYLSALERRRDFAVMKAVGASSRGLLAGLAAQSILIALVAALVATGIQQLLVPVFPIPIEVPAGAYIQLPILALLAGALASLGGLRKAVNVDPALAFSGPGG